jgi:hypothetical protein
LASLEQEDALLLQKPAAGPIFDIEQRARLLHSVIEPMLNREIHYRGLAAEQGGLSTRLIAWVEAAARNSMRATV